MLTADPLSITRQNGYGQSRLHMHYTEKHHYILMLFMKQYSDIIINMRDNNGMTPLHYACMYGKDDVVEQLLQYPKINVNAKQKHNKYNTTPLHCAVSYHLGIKTGINMVRKLLLHPDIIFHVKNHYNETALDIVNKHIVNNQKQHEHLLEFIEMKKLLEDFAMEQRWKVHSYLLSSNWALKVCKCGVP